MSLIVQNLIFWNLNILLYPFIVKQFLKGMDKGRSAIVSQDGVMKVTIESL
jgi:hypothetical protein